MVMQARGSSRIILKETVVSKQGCAQFARKCVAELVKGDIVCLHGTLGAGKTFIAREMIRAITGDDLAEVPSPTYTLAQTYDSQDFRIWHFDFYRLEDAEEIYEIGWDEAISGNLVLIEWPEKAENLIPAYAKHLYIEFDKADEETEKNLQENETRHLILTDTTRDLEKARKP